MSSNRKRLSLFLALTLLLVLLAPAAPAGANGTNFNDHHPGNNESIRQILGSWSGVTQDGVRFLLSFELGGTYTITFSVPGVGAASGHGVYRRSGLATFDLTDNCFIFSPVDGSVQLIQKTRGAATVSANGKTFQISLNVTVTLPDGTPAGSATNQATATRIEVQPLP